MLPLSRLGILTNVLLSHLNSVITNHGRHVWKYKYGGRYNLSSMDLAKSEVNPMSKLAALFKYLFISLLHMEWK